MKDKIYNSSVGRHSCLTEKLLIEAYDQGRTDAIDECKEVINNVFRDYRNDFNLGVTCVDMHNSINKKIEQLKERTNG